MRYVTTYLYNPVGIKLLISLLSSCFLADAFCFSVMVLKRVTDSYL